MDCLYLPTKCLQHDFEAQVIPVGETVNVNFTFYARDAIKYQEVVTFEINGLSRQSVEIYGQGTEMKVLTLHLYSSSFTFIMIITYSNSSWRAAISSLV